MRLVRLRLRTSLEEEALLTTSSAVCRKGASAASAAAMATTAAPGATNSLQQIYPYTQLLPIAADLSMVRTVRGRGSPASGCWRRERAVYQAGPRTTAQPAGECAEVSPPPAYAATTPGIHTLRHTHRTNQRPAGAEQPIRGRPGLGTNQRPARAEQPIRAGPGRSNQSDASRG